MKDFYKYFLPVAAGVIVLWISWWCYVTASISDAAKQGQLGDLFGGINAVFSGLALAGVVTAVVLQSKELALQRDELKLTRLEYNRMAKANEDAALALSKQLAIQATGAKINGLAGILNALTTLQNGANTQYMGSNVRVSYEGDIYAARQKLDRALQQMDETL